MEKRCEKILQFGFYDFVEINDEHTVRNHLQYVIRYEVRTKSIF